MAVLKLDPQKNFLIDVPYIPSPYADQRPANTSINMIVIHGISLPPGEFGSDHIEHFFCGSLDTSAHPYFEAIATLRVSAHLLIKRTGQIIQFVPFGQRAWHAGVSQFGQEQACNDFSIGIELEGTDNLAYELIQYERLNKVIRVLMQAFTEITFDRIVGHADIAPGRKTDPGEAFDWALLEGK